MKKSTRLKFRPEYPADFNFDFKDPLTLYRFLTEGGKILPQRISKLSAHQQRASTAAIKLARSMSMLPTGADAYDNFERPEPISPQPVEL